MNDQQQQKVVDKLWMTLLQSFEMQDISVWNANSHLMDYKLYQKRQKGRNREEGHGMAPRKVGTIINLIFYSISAIISRFRQTDLFVSYRSRWHMKKYTFAISCNMKWRFFFPSSYRIAPKSNWIVPNCCNKTGSNQRFFFILLSIFISQLSHHNDTVKDVLNQKVCNPVSCTD